MKRFKYIKYMYLVPIIFLMTLALWGCEESSVNAVDETDITGLNPVEAARPDWAGNGGGSGDHGNGNGNGIGNPNAGTKKGDVYGDMYVLLRDEDGVPILSEDGYLQPIGEDGKPLLLDEEGKLVNEEEAIEVEIGRLNVGRSPTKVVDRRLNEVFILLEQADTLSTDAAGRLVVNTGEVTKTIDAPLENLALYRALMNEGSLAVTLKPGVILEDGLEVLFDYDTEPGSDDMVIASSLLAGGTDKTIEMSIDQIIYVNTILELEGTRTVNGIEYIEYSNFTYNRFAKYGSKTADVLIETSPGIFEKRTVNIFDTVFGGNEYTQNSSIAAFTQAAEDARRVINYIHEYEVPVTL